MKKLTKQTSQHQKLALRREAIASLTPPQLGQVAGGLPLASALGGCGIETVVSG